MNFVEIGKGTTPGIVFAHGWARDHRDFIPTAEALVATQKSLLVDLPGFGATPRPTESWTTKEYADDAAAFIREKIGRPIVWVGHSFGGHVGLRLAIQHPDVLRGLIIVSSPGVPLARPWWVRQRGKLRQAQFRRLRARAKGDPATVAALEKRFGSPDYVASQELGMRDIFLNAVRANQTADLPRIKTPTLFLYGAKDTETPPELGRRMATLVPGARFLLLPEFDHISVLFRGHHIIALRAKEMAEGRPS
jgi:pimeloyl-ACP methyl ester carboxylesterase